jgi:hypothetical protein
MADNKFTNTNWVSMEILRLLLNKLVVAEYFSRDWQGDFDKEFAPGSTISAKLPWRPIVKDGMGYEAQNIERVSTTISLDQWTQVPFEWDDYERAVKLERSEDQLRENYWDPCAAAMAQEMDSRAAKFAYQNASNTIGVLGTDPTLVGLFYSARQQLTEESCPPGKRAAIISSSAMQAMGAATGAGSIVSMFQPADEITKMFKEGSVGRMAGFDVFESNSLWSHTAGTWGGAVTVNGANQSGTQIKITATAADTFKKGDKISIALVNRVNPQTRRISGKAALRRFTITADLTAVGGGDAADVLNILPAIYGPGSQYQNVDALPATGAALTLWPDTTSPNGKVGTVGLALSRFAFALVAAKLYVPKAVESAGQAQDPDTKIAIRKVSAWDPVRSMQINRMDSLFGFGNLYQSNGACAIAMG